MPERPTEIPHFAFTHHRIGLHKPEKSSAASAKGVQTLVPLADISHLPPLDQKRCLGLAYLQVSELSEHFQHAEFYRERARRILDDVRQQGLNDPAVDAALARLYWHWRVDPFRTIELAKSVLSADHSSPNDYATALFTLGATYFQQGNPERAIPLLEKLVQVRRYADAWNVLSICKERTKDLSGALEAARQAAVINPDRYEFQRRLAELYSKANKPDLSDWHQQRARQLAEILGKP